ncbi:hypothetical protein A2U01_0078661, partial [Trifolium medium]|nr:hypothetical protein [Trifolium medium]
IHQVLRRTGPVENDREPHPTVCPSHHRSLPAVEGDMPHNPDSIHPEHGSDAPTVLWSVSENAPLNMASEGTAGSRKE